MAERDISIKWRGDEVFFSPAFRFLRKLDAQLRDDPDHSTNLLQVANVIGNGGEGYLDIPIVWAAFLKEAGFDASEADCWEVVSAVHSKMATPEQVNDYYSFYVALSKALVPVVDMGKPHALDEAPAPTQSKKTDKSAA
jgi:hypothetical protein